MTYKVHELKPNRRKKKRIKTVSYYLYDLGNYLL